jgi:hypothetical protein
MCCGPGWTTGAETRVPAASCGLPVGLIWSETDGEILMHPSEAVTGVIAAIFGRFLPSAGRYAAPGCGCMTRA